MLDHRPELVFLARGEPGDVDAVTAGLGLRCVGDAVHWTVGHRLVEAEVFLVLEPYFDLWRPGEIRQVPFEANRAVA